MKIHTYLIALTAAFLWVAPSYAQSANNGIPQTVQEMKDMAKPKAKAPYEKIKPVRVPAVRHRVVVEEKTIRVSPGKSKTVSLDRDAVSVIVANPAHATVFLDSPRLLVIMPRSPGATELTVLDAKGQEILKKGILVDGAGDDHVRIRRICGDGVTDCEPETIYYCPGNNCAEVASPEPDPSGAYPLVPAVVSPSSADAGDDFDDNGENLDPEEPTGDDQ